MPFVLSLSKHRPSAAPQERTALRQAQGERMRGSYPLFRAFLTLWLLIAGATFVRAETVVFTDVNVVPMDRERVIPRPTVIVTDGAIASIRLKAQLPAGSSVTVDRKRVVSGKSVAVRAAIGRRRLIKNKTYVIITLPITKT